jgi:hypothetical protein
VPADESPRNLDTSWGDDTPDQLKRAQGLGAWSSWGDDDPIMPPEEAPSPTDLELMGPVELPEPDTDSWGDDDP